MDPLYVAVIGIFIGALYRTFKPYLQKAKDAAAEEKDIDFKMIYLYSMLSSIVTCLAITMMILPGFPIPAEPQNILILFGGAFTFGYTTNSEINSGI